MTLDVKNEDLDICRECGGMCCIKCGCDYGIVDFKDRTYKGFLDMLNVGDKSIVAMINFTTLSNGKFVAEPTLYIRARNINRDIVDLISMKTRCASLTENGCMHDYDTRPFGGKNLKPSREVDGPCRPIINPLLLMEEWKPYQKQLSKIVKFYTGMGVMEKISLDVEDLFYRCLTRDYEGVSELEMIDLKGFVSLLKRAYPEEFVRTFNKSKGISYSRVLKK